MTKHSLFLIILFIITQPVLAHDGSEHVSDVEMLVAGVGIILLALSLLSLYFRKPTQVSEEDTLF